LQEIITS
jgi:hypothetical protein